MDVKNAKNAREPWKASSCVQLARPDPISQSKAASCSVIASPGHRARLWTLADAREELFDAASLAGSLAQVVTPTRTSTFADFAAILRTNGFTCHIRDPGREAFRRLSCAG
jgi:hypothetical protein